MNPKKAMIRIVRSREGEVSIDPTGKKPGKGAYLCKTMECIKKAGKYKNLGRALDISVPEEIYTELEKYAE